MTLSILDDPQASPEALEALAREYPEASTWIAIAQHPNCPPDFWWKIVEEHPRECLRSPAAPLFLLEEPGRWKAIEEQKLHVWLRRGTRLLPVREQRLFACDCAEHVLPIWEAAYPENMAPRRAIELARALAHEKLGSKKAATLKIRRASQDAYEAWASIPLHGAVRYAAESASYCAEEPALWLPSKKNNDRRAVRYAIEEAQDAAKFAHPDNEEAIYDERRWQWNVLQRYLDEESPV